MPVGRFGLQWPHAPLPPHIRSRSRIDSASFNNRLAQLQAAASRLEEDKSNLLRLLANETVRAAAAARDTRTTATSAANLARLVNNTDALVYGLPTRLSATEAVVFINALPVANDTHGTDRVFFSPYRRIYYPPNNTAVYESLLSGRNASSKLLLRASAAVAPAALALRSDAAGAFLYTAHGMGVLHKWDADTLAIVQSRTVALQANVVDMDLVDAGDDGATVCALALDDGTVALFDFDGGRVTAQFKVDLNGKLSVLTAARDRKTFFAAGADSIVHHFSPNGTEVRAFKGGHTQTILALAVSENNTYLASGGSEAQCVIWDGHSGKTLSWEFAIHAPVVSAAISHDGTFALFGANEGRAKLLGPRSASNTWPDANTYLAFCPGGVCKGPVKTVHIGRDPSRGIMTSTGINYGLSFLGDFEWDREMPTETPVDVSTLLPDDNFAVVLANGTLIVMRKLEEVW